MASEGQKAASESPLRLAIEALHGRARALSEYYSVYRSGAGPGPVAAAISGSASCATISSACRPGPGTCRWPIAGPGGGARSIGSVACSAVTGASRPAGLLAPVTAEHATEPMERAPPPGPAIGHRQVPGPGLQADDIVAQLADPLMAAATGPGPAPERYTE